MTVKCLLLVLFKVIYAVIDFGALEFNLCYSGDNKFSVLVGRTIEQCMDECIAREYCKALNFRTKMKICELFATTSSEDFSPGECLYADKTNLQPSSTQNVCKRGEVQKTSGCVIKECINITIPEHGSVLGNMRNVGKDIRYKCEHGYKVKDNVPTPVAECLDTGLWSVNVECVKMAYTWATWTAWSQCSVSCGGGQRTRTRSCTIPIQGIGDVQCLQDDPVNHPGIESETCNHPTCEAPTIGKLCTVDADCIETEGMCIGGRCFCNALYRYSVSLQN
ncbi:SCO-spondin-like [Ruditapes philippinarum]|uniref:SCO-spondin-like n=1 Tax=Ruditapes philippinarum TaxID=129788 RepID=UPI00295B6104|nr:SCO-spondin-like [Ruditapes philippinarum]